MKRTLFPTLPGKPVKYGSWMVPITTKTQNFARPIGKKK